MIRQDVKNGYLWKAWVTGIMLAFALSLLRTDVAKAGGLSVSGNDDKQETSLAGIESGRDSSTEVSIEFHVARVEGSLSPAVTDGALSDFVAMLNQEYADHNVSFTHTLSIFTSDKLKDSVSLEDQLAWLAHLAVIESRLEASTDEDKRTNT